MAYKRFCDSSGENIVQNDYNAIREVEKYGNEK